MHVKTRVGALALAMVVGASATPAMAQRESAQDMRKAQTAQIPTCAKSLGTISVLEPEDGVS